MSEPRIETQTASDGYTIHVAVWPVSGTPRGRVVVLHGVQSHGGWYHRLGQTLAKAGYEAHFPDRRGSGANRADRGHAPSSHRLIDDITEWLTTLRNRTPAVPTALAGISWGGKPAVIAAGKQPRLIDALALICPGLHPRVDVTRRERLGIALAWLTNRRKTFPIPLGEPTLFTDSPEGQAFIASDNLSLHAGTAGLLAASFFIDKAVRRIPSKVHQPALLMLAGQDRIVNNDLTLTYFERLASPDRHLIIYSKAHHTLEFEPDPERYALDLIEWLDSRLFANSDVSGRVDP
ncbi:alpha/beta fold hydrolase [Singulisphaera acidiphila]|uniref:Lysophospholipase n=1 Tax=Singulisphaera acidiphila (strain ATCC BAA-1392 / DSM 18658 / VKM B-2454 / MOB10) TaxID=886293 RepID=L0DNA2_SINAD|nr:alpha/beta fold hydrolase [Singulisphaera acidiphila]AGA30318.1 lysophospholipase [Singulisphaera acidiphila DSM 18658]